MTKNIWYLNLGVVAAIWGIDALTKWLAATYIPIYIHNFEFWGPFGLALHFNPGAMLGTFSTLPPVLRVVSLSTGGAFLVFIYIAIQHLIPTTVTMLRVGMSILLGGILGNVTDRILRGAVTDFLLLGTQKFPSPAFNVADMVQWVGYGLIVFSLVRDGNLFWPEYNIRRKLWVNPSFQVRYIGILIAMGLGFVAISGVFFYTYLKVTIDALAVVTAAPEMEHRFLSPFYITYFVISTGFIVMLFVLGRILSHRTAGPLYAFEKFLEDLLSGKARGLKLRAGDDFQHLEDLAVRLRKQFEDDIVKEDQAPVVGDGVVTPLKTSR